MFRIRNKLFSTIFFSGSADFEPSTECLGIFRETMQGIFNGDFPLSLGCFHLF